MGFDALVFCNCFKEGKTKPFPLPELAEYFRFDSDMYLGLDLPWNDTTAESHNIVDTWVHSNPCEHEALAYCFVHLATNKGYWHFYRTLEKIGWDHFPTLHSALPKANSGYMLAKDVSTGLSELEYFNQLNDLGTDVTLLESETNETIWEHSGIWIMQFDKFGVGVNVGIDEQGFFIAPNGDEHAQNTGDIYKKALDVSKAKKVNIQTDTLFRAWRFEQQVLESKPKPTVEYHNIESGQRFISEVAIELNFSSTGSDLEAAHQYPIEYPRNLIVQEYVLKPSDFSYIVEPLIKVFNASIETGNPVVWS